MGGDGDLGPWLHTNYSRAGAVAADGGVLGADTLNCRVRKVNADSTAVSVVGNGSCRASGDGGPASRAGLSPWGMATDAEGNLYVADVFNCRIRRIDTARIITTVAGTGTCGFSGDGSPATEASLSFAPDVGARP